MNTQNLDLVARQFPLVPRPQPTRPPLAQRITEITELAHTPSNRTGADARIAAAHNGCGGFVRHRLLASSDTAGHVSVPRMLVCVDTASAPDGCQVVRCFVAWARR
jgi:hypothetical protein